jgi:two-component system, cell cycle response regulator DivK
MTTVLFVEDQLELRAIHTAYLNANGYHVVTAADGESGIELARRVRPDIIVLDYSLPVCNGVDVAQTLQKDPGFTKVPIVMLTAIPYGAIGKKAVAAGCVAFLAKPCTPSRLLLELKRFLPAAKA